MRAWKGHFEALRTFLFLWCYSEVQQLVQLTFHKWGKAESDFDTLGFGVVELEEEVSVVVKAHA